MPKVARHKRLQAKVEYRWRHKKTGRFVKARSKGSRRIIFYSLRWAKGTPLAGRYIKKGVKIYEVKHFAPIKKVPFKKAEGGDLYGEFGDLKVYRNIIRIKAKILEVKVSGFFDGKRFVTKFVINLFGKGTAEIIRDTVIARLFGFLDSKDILISPKKKDVEKVYTPSEYAKHKLLTGVTITLSYV